MAQGIAQGLEKGKNEGKTIGMQNAKIETAKNMLSDGLSANQIAKYTGLSLEEIDRIEE